MAEYISKQAFKEKYLCCGWLPEMSEEEFNSFPAAGVVPVRHGRWIPSDMGGGEPDEAYICSECGEPWILNEGTPEENNMRYCPACGARMDKEDEHEASK